MKKVLIVEDKEIQRRALIELLKNVDYTIQVYEAANIEEAYQTAMKNTINLFLVDIILDNDVSGDVSGLNFAENIRKVSKYSFTPLIFITSLEDPKLHAFRETNCLGYIEKPFDPREVERLIKKAFKFPALKDEDKNVFFRKDGIVYSVRQKDIIYIENIKRKLIVHTTKEVLTLPYKTCEQIMEDLASDDFLQCNRHVIINKNFVEIVDFINRYIRLRGVEESIVIGEIMKKRVKDEFGN